MRRFKKNKFNRALAKYRARLSVGTDGGGEGGTSGNWGGGATAGEGSEEGKIPEGKAMVDPRDLRKKVSGLPV